MSLYADYLAEKGLKGIIETPTSFATYCITGQECYIEDIYVAPEFRKTKEASRLADAITEIAKAKGCTYLTGSVNSRATDPTASIKTLLGYGFKFMRSNDAGLYFYKELS